LVKKILGFNESHNLLPFSPKSKSFFFKEIGFIADGWLQYLHNLGSVKTVPVTSYIEILQNVVLYLFNGGGGRNEV